MSNRRKYSEISWELSWPFILLFLISLTCGCSSQKLPEGSGFLGDASVYQAMHDHPRIKGVRVVNYKPPETLRDGAFILPPVKIYLNPKGRMREVSQTELAELGVFFHNKVFNELNERYDLTNTPGPGVYFLRLAIADADPNAMAPSVGNPLGSAAVELAIEDSTTGELLVAATGAGTGKSAKDSNTQSKWASTEAVLSNFAKLIRQRLDEIHSSDVVVQ